MLFAWLYWADIRSMGPAEDYPALAAAAFSLTAAALGYWIVRRMRKP